MNLKDIFKNISIGFASVIIGIYMSHHLDIEVETT